MQAIIIGCGRVGSTVAKRLASEGWHVTAIDEKEAALSRLGEVEWRPMPEAKVSMVRVLRPGAPADRSTWPALDDWMADALETMQTLFRPIAKTLDASEAPPAAAGGLPPGEALAPETLSMESRQ